MYRLRGVCVRVLELFVRHVCLVRPLREGGKMKITTDMTQVSPGSLYIEINTVGEEEGGKEGGKMKITTDMTQVSPGSLYIEINTVGEGEGGKEGGKITTDMTQVSPGSFYIIDHSR